MATATELARATVEVDKVAVAGVAKVVVTQCLEQLTAVKDLE